MELGNGISCIAVVDFDEMAIETWEKVEFIGIGELKRGLLIYS